MHSTIIRNRDPLEQRLVELEAQRDRLFQGLRDWSWSPGEPLKDQSVLGVLMNMKMAAYPCRENFTVRQAAMQYLHKELSKVDRELVELAAARAVADFDSM